MSLIPFIRSFISKRRALLAISISLDREIISPCSRYIKKGLVYIAIISPTSRQSSFCFKYTKANTYLSCDMRSVPFNKYKFPHYVRRCTY